LLENVDESLSVIDETIHSPNETLGLQSCLRSAEILQSQYSFLYMLRDCELFEDRGDDASIHSKLRAFALVNQTLSA
jgi:hypothetical protein